MNHIAYDDDRCKIDITDNPAGYWVTLNDDYETAQHARNFTEALEMADEMRTEFIETWVMT